MNDLEQRVIALIATQTGIESEAIHHDTRLDDLGRDADSLDWVELVLAIESEFGIAVPETIGPETPQTVGDLIAWIRRILGDDGGAGVGSRLQGPPQAPGDVRRRRPGE